MSAPTATQPGPSTKASTSSPAQLQTAFDNGIWYALSLWAPLHIAIQNQWGGPDSADKRDWFAGAVSELMITRPQTDGEDLEEFMLQIMVDEFETNVEDESEVEVARTVLRLRNSLFGDPAAAAGKRGEAAVAEESGDMRVYEELVRRWQNRGSMKTEVQVRVVNQEMDGEGEEQEWGGIAEDDEDEEDEEMGEAPPLVPAAPREKPEPEVDEDGFQKVVGKKRR
nr:pre-rrna-processing protein tsr2 [Quercus suber]